MERIKIRLHFKIQDLWIGLYWEKVNFDYTFKNDYPTKTVRIWICIIPCFPIYIVFKKKK